MARRAGCGHRWLRCSSLALEASAVRAPLCSPAKLTFRHCIGPRRARKCILSEVRSYSRMIGIPNSPIPAFFIFLFPFPLVTRVNLRLSASHILIRSSSPVSALSLPAVDWCRASYPTHPYATSPLFGLRPALIGERLHLARPSGPALKSAEIIRSSYLPSSVHLLPLPTPTVIVSPDRTPVARSVADVHLQSILLYYLIRPFRRSPLK